MGEDGTRVRLLVSGSTRTCSLRKYANTAPAQSSLAFCYVDPSFSALRSVVVVSCVHMATCRFPMYNFRSQPRFFVQAFGGRLLLIVSLQHCLHGVSRSDSSNPSFLRCGGLRGCAAFFCLLFVRLCPSLLGGLFCGEWGCVLFLSFFAFCFLCLCRLGSSFSLVLFLERLSGNREHDSVKVLFVRSVSVRDACGPFTRGVLEVLMHVHSRIQCSYCFFRVHWHGESMIRTLTRDSHGSNRIRGSGHGGLWPNRLWPSCFGWMTFRDSNLLEPSSMLTRNCSQSLICVSTGGL